MTKKQKQRIETVQKAVNYLYIAPTWRGADRLNDNEHALVLALGELKAYLEKEIL